MESDGRVYQPVGVHPQNLIEHYILQSTNQQTSALVNVLNSTNALKAQLQTMDSTVAAIAQQLTAHSKRTEPAVSSKADILKLVGAGNAAYQYKLRLASHLHRALSKGKIFTFTVTLHPLGQGVPEESEMIPLEFCIYNCEYPSQLIGTNKYGESLIELDTDHCALRYSAAREKHSGHVKARLNEVTSHYFNGWVFIVVTASHGSSLGASVKPLVISNIRVKSKVS